MNLQVGFRVYRVFRLKGFRFRGLSVSTQERDAEVFNDLEMGIEVLCGGDLLVQSPTFQLLGFLYGSLF